MEHIPIVFSKLFGGVQYCEVFINYIIYSLLFIVQNKEGRRGGRETHRTPVLRELV